MTSTPHAKRITPDDTYLFGEGTHRRLHERMGAHAVNVDGSSGVAFAVWAPNAEQVAVIGDFNGWDGDAHLLRGSDAGIWEGFVDAVEPGARYKYRVSSRIGGYRVDKADPFAFGAEVPPRTASVVTDLAHEWSDSDWMGRRGAANALNAPVSVYEMHLGSWRRHSDGAPLGYREIAEPLIDHVQRLGFSHVEFLPVMEHPFGGSWGYQTTGFFAPTARFGAPNDFKALIDELHRHGIGVFLDWVPSHFPSDEHGLAFFDGTHLFEHADPRQGLHPDWGSLIFNYGRGEVRSFLASNARFWLDEYHADGLRVDAVASMLYLDYSRKAGEWIPNRYGGRENLEALDFLRRLNEGVYEDFPDVQMIAEESTAWPMVSRPTYLGGLGFGLKWDMGWMNDTLDYFGHDPVHRAWHHHQLTFRSIYQFSENFMLPLSHDEVVHGKGSLYERMPGNPWERRANLRLLLGTMVAQPGKKLLFMGAELGSRREWDHDGQLEWDLLDDPDHAGIARWLADCNRLYRERPALHELDCDPEGFEWVHADDAKNSVVAWLRRARDGASVLVVANFTPIPRTLYRLGVDSGGRWRELLNSDAQEYGGSGEGNLGEVESEPVPYHGRPHSVVLTLGPLAILLLERVGPAGPALQR